MTRYDVALTMLAIIAMLLVWAGCTVTVWP